MTAGLKKFNEYMQGLSREHRQIVHGVGTATDPCPRRSYRTFIRSDEEALWADWSNVGRDMMSAFARARNDRKRQAG